MVSACDGRARACSWRRGLRGFDSLATASWVCPQPAGRPADHAAQVRPLLLGQLGHLGGGLVPDRLRLGSAAATSSSTVFLLHAVCFSASASAASAAWFASSTIRCASAVAVRRSASMLSTTSLACARASAISRSLAGLGLGLALGDVVDRGGPELVDLERDGRQLGPLGLLQLGGPAFQFGPVLAAQPLDLGMRFGDLRPGTSPGRLGLALDRGPQVGSPRTRPGRSRSASFWTAACETSLACSPASATSCCASRLARSTFCCAASRASRASSSSSSASSFSRRRLCLGRPRSAAPRRPGTPPATRPRLPGRRRAASRPPRCFPGDPRRLGLRVGPQLLGRGFGLGPEPARPCSPIRCAASARSAASART